MVVPVSSELPSLFRDRVDLWETQLHDEILAGLAWRPVFNFLIEVGPGERSLQNARETLASLARQSYRDWHVSVLPRRSGDDFDSLRRSLESGAETVASLRARLGASSQSGATALARLYEGCPDIDARVVLAPRSRDLLLAEIAVQDGPSRPAFVGVLSPGDVLSADCLVEFALHSGLHDDADFIYGDDERRNIASGAVEPFCKPDWSPDLLLSTNYIGNAWCAEAGLLRRSGITVEEVLRHGRYDLVLRLTEQARSISHLKSVLLRTGADSAEPEESESAAVGRALSRSDIDADVTKGRVAGTYRVRRRLSSTPLVSIILPTGGNLPLLRKCLTGLFEETDYQDFELIILYNNSTRPEAFPYLETVAADARVRVIDSKGPFNYSRICNIGAAAARHPLLLFLNDDVEAIDPGWLGTLVAEAMRPEVGVVGPQLLYPDGTVQHAGIFLLDPVWGRHAFRHLGRDDPGYFGLALTQRNVTVMTGACLLTRREVFDRVGGFEEAHDIINNDVDYCLKIRRSGLLCVYTPHTALIHHERATRQEAPDNFDRALFEAEWRPTFSRGDPYHPPRLSVHRDDLAVDPEDVQVLGSRHPLFAADRVRNILVLKLDYLGDCIGAIPAIQRLSQLFPTARLVVLSGPWGIPIWSLAPEVDEVIPFEFFDQTPGLPPNLLGPEDLEALRARLAPYRFDLAIDLRRFPETRPLLRYSGARYTAGFDFKSQFPWLDIALEWQGDEPGRAKQQNVADGLVSLVDAIARAMDPGRPSLTLSGHSPPGWPAEPFDRPVVCVHTGAGSEIKRWPAAFFAELIDRLIEDDDVDVALIGGESDLAPSAAVLAKSRYPERIRSLVGKIALDALPDFLAECALFVGNDSGPKHLAAALGVPTVGIHSGNVDAREWGPVGPRAVAVRKNVTCSPCFLIRSRDCPRGVACLTDLRPMDVYPVCQRLLAIRGLRRENRDVVSQAEVSSP